MSDDRKIEGGEGAEPPDPGGHPQGSQESRAAGSPPDSSLTFIGRDSALARTVGRPLLHFLHIETSGGILLLLATVAALIWVNSPVGDSYAEFLAHPNRDLGERLRGLRRGSARLR